MERGQNGAEIRAAGRHGGAGSIGIHWQQYQYIMPHVCLAMQSLGTFVLG